MYYDVTARRGLLRHRSGRPDHGGAVRNLQATPFTLETPWNCQELPVPEAAHGFRGSVQEDALRAGVEAAQRGGVLPPVDPLYSYNGIMS